MPEPEEGAPHWEVICSPVNAEILRQLQRRASRSVRGEAFALAFRQIIEPLQHDPAEVGEPLYRLPALRLEVGTIVVRPLAIDFAVCEDQPLVSLKVATLLGEQSS
jgi:hypothetical protein